MFVSGEYRCVDVFLIQIHKAGITGIVAIDGYICTASLDQTIKIWNINLEQVLFNVVRSGVIVSCAFAISSEF